MFFIGHDLGSTFTGKDQNGPNNQIGPHCAERMHCCNSCFRIFTVVISVSKGRQLSWEFKNIYFYGWIDNLYSFTALPMVFYSNEADGRVIMKGCVQWN